MPSSFVFPEHLATLLPYSAPARETTLIFNYISFLKTCSKNHTRLVASCASFRIVSDSSCHSTYTTLIPLPPSHLWSQADWYWVQSFVVGRSPGDWSSPRSIWSGGHSSAWHSAGLAFSHGLGSWWMQLRNSAVWGLHLPGSLPAVLSLQRRKDLEWSIRQLIHSLISQSGN